MNPVDHPMGGGEGRASGGHPRSRKGLIAKGKKTRNTKKSSNKYIISKAKSK
jgi:large subunit ribosomal protein L2